MRGCIGMMSCRGELLDMYRPSCNRQGIVHVHAHIGANGCYCPLPVNLYVCTHSCACNQRVARAGRQAWRCCLSSTAIGCCGMLMCELSKKALLTFSAPATAHAVLRCAFLCCMLVFHGTDLRFLSESSRCA